MITVTMAAFLSDDDGPARSQRRSSPRSASGHYAGALRRELSARNRAYARRHQLPYTESYGAVPVIVYEPDADELRHGNFLDSSFRAIRNNPAWNKRLSKIHAQAKSSLPKCERGWKELDSCNSSDALLMNIFCYPGVAASPVIASLLGVAAGLSPDFGFKARVPLGSGLLDRTEVDMRLGSLLVEAKLTESDFQSKPADVLEGYRDFRKVFDVKLLPKADGVFQSYQLLRNVLAASANDCSFCVLLDARRPDLLESWYGVMRAVRMAEMRVRCKALTWQELTAALPSKLQKFLDLKYGIAPPGCVPSEVSPQEPGF